MTTAAGTVPTAGHTRRDFEFLVGTVNRSNKFRFIFDWGITFELATKAF